MPKILLRNQENRYFITEVEFWPAAWSRETPPVVRANVFGRVESVYYLRTDDWLDGKRLYVEAPELGVAIPYELTTKESHAK